MSDLQNKIKELICKDVLVGITVDEIANDAGLVSDLHLDSIQMMELIAGLENEFSIVLEDEDLDMQIFSTVESLAKLVGLKLEK